MGKTPSALKTLRDAGFRLTRARKAIITELGESEVPLSADEIRERISARGVSADRSTVYREIAFLRERSLLHDIHLGDGKQRYKACPEGDHHHIICTGCSRTRAVPVEGQISEYGTRIAEAQDFHVTRQSLEFFGLCASCRGRQ